LGARSCQIKEGLCQLMAVSSNRPGGVIETTYSWVGDDQVNRRVSESARVLVAQDVIADPYGNLGEEVGDDFLGGPDQMQGYEVDKSIVHAPEELDLLESLAKQGQRLGPTRRLELQLGPLEDIWATFDAKSPTLLISFVGTICDLRGDLGSNAPTGPRFGDVDVYERGSGCRCQHPSSTCLSSDPFLVHCLVRVQGSTLCLGQ